MFTHAASRSSRSAFASVVATVRSGAWVRTTSAPSREGVVMRFVMLAIVLLFPLVDLLVTARFARWTGVPMWMWLTGSAIAGLWVLANERVQFRSEERRVGKECRSRGSP